MVIYFLAEILILFCCLLVQDVSLELTSHGDHDQSQSWMLNRLNHPGIFIKYLKVFEAVDNVLRLVDLIQKYRFLILKFGDSIQKYQFLAFFVKTNQNRKHVTGSKEQFQLLGVLCRDSIHLHLQFGPVNMEAEWQ